MPKAAQAQTTTQATLPIFPKYMILGVVYAPPGASSNVIYGNSSLVGATNSFQSNWGTTASQTSSTTTGGGLFGFGDTQTNSTTTGWTDTFSTSNTLSVQTTQGNSISTVGPISSSLGVDHDNDVIYILLNPVITTTATVTTTGSTTTFAPTWTGIDSNGCDFSASGDQPVLLQHVFGCDPNQYPFPDIVGIPVWCLKNPYSPVQGCAQWIAYTSRSWDNSYRGQANPPAVPGGTTGQGSAGYPENPTNPPGLTLQDYADILEADPFVALNGSSRNLCHSGTPIDPNAAYGPNFDPNDSETIPYVPAANSSVIAVLVTNGGSGYTSAPTVSFNGGVGGGSSGAITNPATGVAFINGSGTVTSVVITNAGSYNANAASATPIVSFSGGGSPTLSASAVAYLSRAPQTCGTKTIPANSTINRFQYYGTVEYPAPGPNGLPSTYNGTFNYSTTNQVQNSAADSHTYGTSSSNTVSFSISAGLSYGFSSGIGISLGLANFDDSYTNSNSNSTTWGSQSTNGSVGSQTSSASYAITGPQLSDNYTGPATYNVYLDNVYGTFAFYSPLDPPVTLGNISINPVCGTSLPSTYPANPACAPPALTSLALPPFPQSAPISPSMTQSQSPPQQLLLTNTSTLYPITMAWPAVTFSDPGFQLITSWNGTAYQDLCSNAQLQPLGSCTVWVQFVPQLSDAPNPVTLANTPSVQATMIAAATVNANSYQNILITDQAAVTGTATGSSGATLLPNGVAQSTLTNTNPIPYLFTYGSYVGAPLGEPFVFKNNSSAPMTISAIQFTNAASYSYTTSGSSTPCPVGTGASVAPGASCQITVNYQPPSGTTAAIGTGISVVGTSNSCAAGFCPAQTLAVAGAVAPAPGGVSVNTTNLFIEQTTICNPGCVTLGGSTSGTFTIANTTPYTANLNLAFSTTNVVGNGIFTYSNGCSATLTGGNSCTITVTAEPETCTPSGGGTGSCSVKFDIPNFLTMSATLQNSSATPTTYSSVSEVSAAFNYTYLNCGSGEISCEEQVVIVNPGGSQTVSPGGVAQYSLQVTPAGLTFPAAVTFTATGLPSGATASFSPATFAANSGGGTVVLSIQTPSASALATPPGSPEGKIYGPWLALALMPAVVAWRSRKSRRTSVRLLMLTLLMAGGSAALMTLVGCGGTGTPPPTAHTPPQSYTITVSATMGTFNQSITVPLTIQ